MALAPTLIAPAQGQSHPAQVGPIIAYLYYEVSNCPYVR
jgi:hypothetical protein